MRKKISSTLQGITQEEWDGFIEDDNALFRKSIPYENWRDSVLKRDNYTCVKCGVHSGMGKTVILNADHIKPFSLYPDLRLEIDNGQTLCIKCHKVKTKNDWELIKNRNI